MSTTISYRYTLVMRPVVNIEFDEHGNCREHSIQFDVRPEYVYDNEEGKPFGTSELPDFITDSLTEYIESLDLVRFFHAPDSPDEPF